MAGGSGREIVRIPLGDDAERRYGAPYWTIHRGDLQAALADAAQRTQDIALKLGTRVEDFAVHANGVTVQAPPRPARGRRARHRADRRRRPVVDACARACSGQRAPRFRHRTAWRALVPADSGAGGIPRAAGASLARARRPSRALSGARRPPHQHRRHRARRMERDRLVAPPATRDEILRHFARWSWAEQARALLAIPERWLKWALYDRQPPFRWRRGPGDADRGRRPPDAAVPGAGRRHGDRGCRGARRHAGANISTIRPTRCARYEGARRQRTARAQQRVAPPGPHLWADRPGSAASAISRCARWAEKNCCARYDWLYDWQPPATRSRARADDMMFPDHHRRQPAETVLARRAEQAVAAVAARTATSSRAAKLDATLLAIKLQEDAGIDIVSDGEQSRQHFVHGFLEFVDGIDFAHKVEMGIRDNRYKAMVPVVRGALTLKGRVHAGRGAPRPRPHQAQAEDHPARPDDHRRHHRRRALRRQGEDGDGLRRPAQPGSARAAKPTASTSSSSTSRPSTSSWTRSPAGASRRCIAPSTGSTAPPPCTSATATASRPISTGRTRSAASGGNTRRFFRRWRKSRIDQVSVECINSRVPLKLLSLLDGKDVLVGVIDVATDAVETPEQVAARDRRGHEIRAEGAHRRLHQLRHGADAARHRRGQARWRSARARQLARRSKFALERGSLTRSARGPSHPSVRRPCGAGRPCRRCVIACSTQWATWSRRISSSTRRSAARTAAICVTMSMQ